MIFINNKYTDWYNRIIKAAKHRQITDVGEKHHIIPDCFFKNRSRKGNPGWLDGNPNDPRNLVMLTPREHFVCHWLLTKMVSGQAYYMMEKALHGMTRSSRTNADRIYSSLEYERARIANRRASLDRPSGRKGVPLAPEVKQHLSLINSGKIMPDDVKRRISNTLKGRPSHLKGRTLSAEHRKKIGDAQRGKPGSKHTDVTKQRIGQMKEGHSWFNNGTINALFKADPGDGWSKGRMPMKYKPSQDTRNLISAANKGRRWWNNGTKNKWQIEKPGIDWSLGKL